MVCMEYTEPQFLKTTANSLNPLWFYSLYKYSLPVQYIYNSYTQWNVRTVQSPIACTLQIYKYFLYEPYGMYRESVLVHYIKTYTPLWAIHTLQFFIVCTVELNF